MSDKLIEKIKSIQPLSLESEQKLLRSLQTIKTQKKWLAASHRRCMQIYLLCRKRICKISNEL
jgi:hypothetical protein